VRKFGGAATEDFEHLKPGSMDYFDEMLKKPKAEAPAPEVKPGDLPEGYYDKVPMETRMSRSGTEPSHPGFRWEVIDPITGKVMRKDIMTRSGASKTQDNLDNKYGGYKYRVRMVKATELTEKEQQFLN